MCDHEGDSVAHDLGDVRDRNVTKDVYASGLDDLMAGDLSAVGSNVLQNSKASPTKDQDHASNAHGADGDANVLDESE